MNYTIKKITDGIYTMGTQNIHITLDEPYLDEMDLLMISPQEIGLSRVLYGERTIEPVDLNQYAVAKITDIDSHEAELVVRTETLKNQQLQVYLVSYRTLIPVIEVDTSTNKNHGLPFWIYFRDDEGDPIVDETFYGRFDCQVSFEADEQGKKTELISSSAVPEGIRGELPVAGSGTYYLNAAVCDGMGTENFEPVTITAYNRPPEGNAS